MIPGMGCLYLLILEQVPKVQEEAMKVHLSLYINAFKYLSSRCNTESGFYPRFQWVHRRLSFNSRQFWKRSASSVFCPPGLCFCLTFCLRHLFWRRNQWQRVALSFQLFLLIHIPTNIPDLSHLQHKHVICFGLS